MMTDISLKAPEQQSSGTFKTLLITSLVVIALLALAALGFQIYNSTYAKKCQYNGASYDFGANFKSIDGCNTCSCGQNGEAVCTEMACITGTPTVSPTITVTETPSITATATVTPTVTITVTLTPTVSVSTTPVEGMKIYFGKPANEADYATIAPVGRPTDATGPAQYAFAITQLLNGPTAEEKTAGFIGVIKLSGTSTCSGKSFQYYRSGNLLTVTFCKDILYVQNTGTDGGYAGMSLAANGRLLKALTETLKLDGATKVAIKKSDGTCFAKDTGLNPDCND